MSSREDAQTRISICVWDMVIVKVSDNIRDPVEEEIESATQYPEVSFDPEPEVQRACHVVQALVIQQLFEESAIGMAESRDRRKAETLNQQGERMPSLCMTKAEALKKIEAMDESKFPIIVDTWSTQDVLDMSDDDETGPQITREQAIDVLDTMVRDYDANYGITNDLLWNRVSNRTDRIERKRW